MGIKTTTAQGEGIDIAATETTETRDATDAETEGEEFPVSLDNIFEILKNQRRRHVLWYLSERGEPVTLRDLSAYVAAEENGKPVGQLSSQERKRVYVGLYQCHLPKMDDMRFIEFNKNRGVIELGPAAVYAEKYLQEADAPGHSWPNYYLGLVGVGWLLLLGSLATTLLSPAVAGGVFLMLMTACALTHAYTSRTEAAGPGFANLAVDA